jgi:hypothetical protein
METSSIIGTYSNSFIKYEVCGETNGRLTRLVLWVAQYDFRYEARPKISKNQEQEAHD